MFSPSALAIRLQRDSDYKGKPKGYRRTIRVCREDALEDGSDRQLLFEGDVIGHAASHQVSFRDPNGASAFSIAPHRKIMPMRWPVTVADGTAIGVLDQKIVAKGFWAVLDGAGNELFRVIDPQSLTDKIAMQALGGAVSRYVFMAGERVLGAVTEEKREKIKARGLRGFFKTLVTTSDPVLRLESARALPDLRLLAMTVFLLYEITVPLDRST
ncbi:MAG: hypothetical protein AAF495_04935 [Pseudomonadota bacterium]